MKKVYLYKGKISCFRRELDAQKVHNYFVKNDYKIVHKPGDADFIILFTCGVTNEVARYAFKKINKFKKYKAELIVTGCLPETDKKKLAGIFKGKTINVKDLKELDIFFPDNNIKIKDIQDANFLYQDLNEKNKLIKFIKKVKFPKETFHKIMNKIFDNIIKFGLIKHIFLTKSSYFVRIAWGCPGNCSYCATKKAVGPLKSKSIKECVEEFKKGINKGYRSITLVADDCGAYGTDIGLTLPDLLYEIIKLEGHYKIEIESLRPIWMIKYKEDMQKILKLKKISALNIPIQSGNERILKLMNRYSDINTIKQVLKNLKKENSEVVFWTNCILGFPTETEEEFKQTLSTITDINFDFGVFFIFSSRNDTEAENIEQKIPTKKLKKRVKYAKKFLKKAEYKVYRGFLMKFFVFEKKK